MTETLTDPVRLPASYYQRDWVLACRDGRSFYSTPLTWDLHGGLDVDALTQALAKLVRRHDALRTAFRTRGTDVDQIVWPSLPVELRQIDLSGSVTPIADLEARVVEEAERPRELETPPLWHALLVRLEPGHHVLAMFIHHLIFDGWSHGVLHDELVRCYRAATAGRPPRLPDLPLQIGDFAHWERSHRHPDAELWWRENLRSLPPLGELPSVGGRFISSVLPDVPDRTTRALRGVAQRQGVGLNTVLLATVVAARRQAVGDDVLVGVTRASRERPELQRVVGPLLDHVPVRVAMSRDTTVSSLLDSVHQAYRAATARQLPLGLVRQVVPDDLRERRGRLFDTRYNYLPSTSAKEATVGLDESSLRITPRAIDPVRLAPPHTEDHPEVLPLSYILRRQPDGQLAGEVCGHDGLYPPAALQRVADDLAGMLEHVAFAGEDHPLPRSRGTA
jgi:hypothetical protein